MAFMDTLTGWLTRRQQSKPIEVGTPYPISGIKPVVPVPAPTVETAIVKSFDTVDTVSNHPTNLGASFDIAIQHILKHEGGYINHPNDPGGATNYGISLRFLADQGNLGDFNHDGNVNIEDIKMMKKQDAINVYKQLWWEKYNYGSLLDQTIATKIFDMSVNMGASRAHKIVQAALNDVFGLNLTIDGILGPSTRSIINQCTDDKEQIALTAICAHQFKFYTNLIAAKPNLAVFAKGWRTRAYSLSKANSVHG